MTALLEVQNLSKTYRLGSSASLARRLSQRLLNRELATESYLHAVDDISFILEEGESLGLVGESGCGKSTLANLIARLTDPSAGAIHFADQNVGATPAKRFTKHPARGHIQVVFQDSHDSLNPRFTSFDCIAEPLRRIKRFGGAALRARVAEVAEQVGLPAPLLGRFPHQLSGGQKARVNIGRAIAVNPKLLILDEPTSALDVSVQAVILKLLARLRADLGISYLFVSHDLNVVRLLCDRVIVMYLGKIVEVGAAETLFTAARHPYTRALISAIPDYHAAQRAKRVRLDGDPRSPIDPDPQICRFYGRCPRGEERCQREAPILQTIAQGHQAACHFSNEYREAAPDEPTWEPNYDARISRTA